MPLSFVFDQNRCTGCQACQLACVIENQLAPDRSWRKIYTFNERHYPGAPLFHMSLACNHCGDPACMVACPALAYSRDRETGAVLLDVDKCIGCRYCTWACPYDAPKFDTAAGVVTKCTLCNHRVSEGLKPACVDLCPTGALELADLSQDRITNRVAGFTATDLGPAIKIIRLRSDREVPAQATALATQLIPWSPRPLSKVTLKHEWPLLVFTLVAPVLAAMLAAVAFAGLDVHIAAFLTPALAATALGGAHLGKKTRAWRIVLNVADSWLSREIVLFNLFVVAAATYLWLRPTGQWLAWSATILGFVALIAVDTVYRYGVKTASNLPHSASVFLSGLLLAGVMGLNPALAGTAGLAKLALYIWRKIELQQLGGRGLLAGVTRIGLGILVPVALWTTGSPGIWLVVSFVMLGELIDRWEFYLEMNIMTPELQMALDLDQRIGRLDD
jgi:DMSO reductase iron-sulfur subunit